MSHDESAVGATGVLVVATRGTHGPGEVLIKIRGGTETYLAWSDDPLPKGETVLVVQAVGARQVAVVAWAEPVDHTDLSDIA
jgi:membrane protein implicated in regulation of membrane protease activity